MYIVTSCATPGRCTWATTCSCALSAISSHIRRALLRTAASWSGVAFASAACSSCATTSRGGQNVLPAMHTTQLNLQCADLAGWQAALMIMSSQALAATLPCHASVGDRLHSATCTPRAHLVAAQPPLPWQRATACAPGRSGWPAGRLQALQCPAARLSCVQQPAALKSSRCRAGDEQSEPQMPRTALLVSLQGAKKSSFTLLS